MTRELTIRIIGAITVLGVAVLCCVQIVSTTTQPAYLALTASSGPNPSLPTGGTATGRLTGINTVGFEMTHLSSGLHWMIGLNVFLQYLTVAAVLIAIEQLWIHVGDGRPFARSVTVALVVVAGALAVAGSGAEILASLIPLREAQELAGSSPDAQYYYSGGFQFSGVWIIAGALVGLLAGAFAIGARLDRENQRLEHDTEGLV